MPLDSPHWAALHRRSILFLLAAFAIAGAVATFSLPVALFPHVDFPRIVVALEAGDRPADQMLIAITQPVEQTVRAVRGVVGVRSTTTRGSAELSINFRWGIDMAEAMQLVESAVSHALAQLPSGTTFNVRRMDPAVFPVAGYSLTSKASSLVTLRDFAQYELVPLLSTIDGVGSVEVQGGAISEYRVEVDPNRLAAYGLDLAAVSAALSAANVLGSAGRVEDRYKLYLMLADTRFHSIDDIGSTVVRSGTNGVVQVRDIARVYAATEPQWLRVTADGADAVLLQIFQQPDGNTVDIVRNVKQVLEDYRSKLPPDVVLSKWYDQSELILESGSSVRDAIVIGVVLASLVIVLFLRSAANHGHCSADGSGDARGHRAASVRARHELQRDDAGRNGSGGRTDRRRLDRDDRAHHAALAGAGRGSRRVACRDVVAVGARVRATVGGFFSCDDHHIRAAGLPRRCDRRLLPGVGADDGVGAEHFVRDRVARRAAACGTTGGRTATCAPTQTTGWRARFTRAIEPPCRRCRRDRRFCWPSSLPLRWSATLRIATSAPDSCRTWTKAASCSITSHRQEHRLPRRTACCAASRTFCVPIRPWKRIRGEPACSWAAVSPKRIRAISSFA